MKFVTSDFFVTLMNTNTFIDKEKDGVAKRNYRSNYCQRKNNEKTNTVYRKLKI